MKYLPSKIPAVLLMLIVGLLAASNAFGSATITIQNNDAAGVGFNDPTPATRPATGNPGITIGEQRLRAFEFAAAIWGATLTSGPPITIRASWAALPCTTSSGTLARGGATFKRANFTGAIFPDTWYAGALANALGNDDFNGTSPEINSEFNLSAGSTGCFDNKHWYYGLDGNEPSGDFDLVAVLLHEFAHGLGFQTFTPTDTGVMDLGFPSIYDRFLLDNSTGKTWPQMTNAERIASAVNTDATGVSNLVWNGQRVTTDAGFLGASGKDSLGHPQIYAPNPREGGSSVSHWSTRATPNQLMEPNISSNLGHGVTVFSSPQDLTFSLMQDIGWCAGCPQPPPPPPPTPAPTVAPNDPFANPKTISGCSGSVTGHNFAATKEPGEPSHSPDDDPGGGSVWYQWQAPISGSVTMTTAGSSYDTLLAVYTGNSVGGLTTIVKNDDVDPGNVRTSTVTFTASAGTLYKIAVDGWDNERGNIFLNWNAGSNCGGPRPVQFSVVNYSVSEGVDGNGQGAESTGFRTIVVNRTGDTSGAASVDYATSNGIGADGTKDYEIALGTLSFAPGETAKTITVFITDDVFHENPETVNLTLSNPVGTALGSPAAAVLTITSNDATTGANPATSASFNPRFFVRMHYLDFFNREPDLGGLNHWANQTTNCGNPDPVVCRINTSAAFFLSIEFKETGYLVYRTYTAAYGPTRIGGTVPITLAEFLPDLQRIGQGVVVGLPGWDTQLNANKDAYFNDFVTRPQFLALYPSSMTTAAFIDALNTNAGGALSQVERDALVSAGWTRAQLLRRVAEDADLEQAQFNRAFVLMQYFGYMRRNPNEGQDTDFGGYNFWLGKLNEFNGNFVNAGMVFAFIDSIEYKARFGP
jgi:hypothetical protein